MSARSHSQKGNSGLRLIVGGQLERHRRQEIRREKWQRRWIKVRWIVFLILFTTVLTTAMTGYVRLVMRY